MKENDTMYTVLYNGECNFFKWSPNEYYCKSGRCLKYKNGELGSFCSVIQFRFCKSEYKCKDNICIEFNKRNIVISYIQENITNIYN